VVSPRAGFELDWGQILSHLGRLATAYALALPIGWDRERAERSAGLRTFPLVAVATCGYMLIGLSTLQTSEAEARVHLGVVTGMGFIGGGAILKDRSRVLGTATAASLWNTGAIGVAVAFARFEIALTLAFINLLTLRLVTPVKTAMESKGGDTG
jgi:putative Mg2+ transporter-C (MgtC) family protein